MPFFDCFERLGVPDDASPDEVRRAFRRRAFYAHPDRNPGDPSAAQAFKELCAARDILLDPRRRAAHLEACQRHRRQARPPERRAPPPERFRGGRRVDWTAGEPEPSSADHGAFIRGAAAVLLAGLAFGLGVRR